MAGTKKSSYGVEQSARSLSYEYSAGVWDSGRFSLGGSVAKPVPVSIVGHETVCFQTTQQR